MCEIIAILLLLGFGWALFAAVRRGRTILASFLGIVLIAVALLEFLGPWMAFRAHWEQAAKATILDYKHVRIGFEDHEHFWRVRFADEDDIDAFIDANRLVLADEAHDVLANLISSKNENAPSWWPTSCERVLVRKDRLSWNALLIANGECFTYRFSE